MAPRSKPRSFMRKRRKPPQSAWEALPTSTDFTATNLFVPRGSRNGDAKAVERATHTFMRRHSHPGISGSACFTTTVRGQKDAKTLGEENARRTICQAPICNRRCTHPSLAAPKTRSFFPHLLFGRASSPTASPDALSRRRDRLIKGDREGFLAPGSPGPEPDPSRAPVQSNEGRRERPIRRIALLLRAPCRNGTPSGCFSYHPQISSCPRPPPPPRDPEVH